VPDITGRGNNGTLNSGVQQIAIGESGPSVRFNGVDGFINIPYKTDLAPSGSFTVAAWVKPETIPTGRYTRLVERDGVYALRFNQNGFIDFTIWGVTPGDVVGPQLPLDDWTLVAGVYDSANKQMNLYVNGSLVAAATVSGSRSSNSNPMVLGSSTSAERFQGQLDEVRFYNTLLGASDQLGLYNNATTTPTTTTTTFTPVTSTPTRTLTITPSRTYTSSPTYTPSNTPKKTPTGWAPTPGVLDLLTGATFNISTNNTYPRACADGGDGVAYSVINLAATYAVLSVSPSNDCLTQNDEILLINMQGSKVSTANVGHYEFLHIASVNDNTVYFSTTKKLLYGENEYDDTNIGTDSGQQRVVLQRVPNYDNVILNGTLTANVWNGYKYGIIAFRVAGTLSGSGTILADKLGYVGGYGGAGNGGCGTQGESYDGNTGACNSAPNLGGGGVGNNGGGGYGSKGYSGGSGGNTYGDLDLARLFLGSGGGGSNGNTGGTTNGGKSGGKGGGIVLVAANNIGDQSNTWTGVITADGGDGADDAGHSGGGSGGSIRIEGNMITVTAPGNIAALGGSVGDTQRGGGLGRTAVYYRDSFAAGFTPNYLMNTLQNVEDSIFSDSFESGDLSVTPSPWSAFSGDSTQISVDPEAAYWGNYGLAITINSETPEPYVQDDNPTIDGHYRARFYFNPNGVSIPSNGTIDLFRGYSDAVGTTPIFRVQVQKSGGIYQANIGARNDNGNWVNSSWNNLSNGWNALEIEYLASHATGQMSLWVGGVLEQSLTGLDNEGSKVDSVRLGGMGAAAGSSGTVYLDDFDSRRISAPGVLADPGLHNRGLYRYTFTSQPDGQTGKDTTIDSKNSGTNYGISPRLWVGEDPSYTENERSLLQFDLSSIPANAVVQDASLTLTLTNLSGSSARMLCIYLLKPIWDESSATWNNYASGSAWQTAGAGGANDYDSNPLACVSMAGHETAGTQETWTLPATTIQSMVNGSAANRGFILKATVESNTTYGFASSDNSTAAYRPSLTIDYATDQAVDPWVNRNYTYSPDQPHSVTALSTGEAYSYDPNGNMTCRVEGGQTYNQVYNAENRLYIVQLMNAGAYCPNANILAAPADTSAAWNFTYNGDGNLVEQVYATLTNGNVTGTLTTYYFAGGSYEWRSDGKLEKYYAFAGQTAAMIECTWTTNENDETVVTCPDATGLNYFLTDQLGSVVAVLDYNGAPIQQQRYFPFGAVRDISSDNLPEITQTDFGYTGQRNLDAQDNSFSLGLMDYHARFYDPYLNRWAQPDSIIPDGNPQSLNRYSYTLDNPIRYNDPTGHRNCEEDGFNCPGSGSSGNSSSGGSGSSGKVANPIKPPDTYDSGQQERPSIPVDPTNQQPKSDNLPSAVSKTRLVVGTILFGGLLVIGGIMTVIGFGVAAEDPTALVLAAGGLVVAAVGAEGLYQIWRPLLPNTWPKTIIFSEFNIP